MLYDADLKSYTFEELVKLGDELVREAFRELLDKPDSQFYRTVSGYEIDMRPKPDDLYRPLTLAILKSNLYGLNLRDTDWENVLNVILISEDDLSARDVEEGRLPGSYVFIKLFLPFTCYRQADAIIKRYKKLSALSEVLSGVFELFFKTVKRAAGKYGYAEDNSPDLKYYDNFDTNKAFYIDYLKELDVIKLEDFFPDEEDKLKELRKGYLEVLSMTDRINEHKNCTDKCPVCVFNISTCADAWMKKKMKELFRMLCFVDVFNPFDDSFETELFNQAAFPDGDKRRRDYTLTR